MSVGEVTFLSRLSQPTPRNRVTADDATRLSHRQLSRESEGREYPGHGGRKGEAGFPLRGRGRPLRRAAVRNARHEPSCLLSHCLTSPTGAAAAVSAAFGSWWDFR